MKRVLPIIVLIASLFAIVPAQAQDSGDRLVVNFSDPSRPGLLRVNFINGSISVKTHSGKDVIIEGKSAGNRDRRPSTTPDGLRRIDTNATGITVEEENNVMAVSSRGGSSNGGSLEIQV